MDRGGVWGWMWLPWRTKKLHFWNLIRAIWYIPFGNILLKKGKLLDTLSCLKTLPLFLFWCLCQNFYKSLKNLKSECLRGSSLSEASEGEFPRSFRSWKKCNSQTQLGAYLLPTFYWKSIILFQWNIGYYYVYSSHLSIFLLHVWYWLLSCLFL